MNARLSLLALPLGIVLLLAACASTKGLRELDPTSQDFISKVRYTINSEERKAFLALPAEAREPFIEDFWKRRDPTPATPVNEYKEEYYARIERSNRLFSGGGSPGWLQDRGRVYITLGPPDNRITYPRGISFYGLPTEIWWYGLLTIVFIDNYWNEDYRIEPESVGQIAVINQAQREWNLPRERMARPGEENYATIIQGVEVAIEVADGETTRFSVLTPYRNIWLKSSGKGYQALVKVTMKVSGTDGTEVWANEQEFPLDVPKNRLKEILAQDLKAVGTASLKPGPYMLTVVVTNTTDGSKTTIERKFEI